MGELYDDRRQEPRFSASGAYHFQNNEAQGRILDLSLNGATFETADGSAPATAERRHVMLQLAGQSEFVADVLVKHIADDRIGVEFYDMSPQHFATLKTLIEQFARPRRP